MTDIVVRLTQTSAHTLTPQETVYLLHESRDEIDRLRKEVERLNSRLSWRAGNPGATHYPECWRDHYDCAQAEIERLSRDSVDKAKALDMLTERSDRASRAEAKVEETTKALREIERYCPATAEMTAAHMMAQIASDALAGVEPSRPAADAPTHVWPGPGPEPASWYAPDGTKIYRSYKDYCDG